MKRKNRNLIIIAIVLLSAYIILFFMLVSWCKASELDSRYGSTPANLIISREYFYNSKTKMPLKAIGNLEWNSNYRDYKKTLIVETYYSGSKITKVIKCTKTINWWELNKANCNLI